MAKTQAVQKQSREEDPADLIKKDSAADEGHSRNGSRICGTVELPATNSSRLKMDGWNTLVSFWDGLFSGVNC